MCVGDYRLGRLIKTVHSQPLLTAGLFTVIPANEQRVGLWIGNSVSGTTLVYYDSPTLGDAALQQVLAGSDPYYVTLAEHGNLPTIRHSMTISGAAFVVAVVEFFLPEDVIQGFLEDGKVEP